VDKKSSNSFTIIKKDQKETSFFSFSFLKPKSSAPSIAEALQQELQTLYKNYEREKMNFQSLKTEHLKSKRLLFLFQRDLIPGITGELLDGKDQRENTILRTTPWDIKMISWLFLGLLNLGMLFYIFLFALLQDSHHQLAWGRSLGIYLLLDCLFVSSFMVLFTHVVLPVFTMKEVKKIQKKLIETIRQFFDRMKLQQHPPDEEGEEDNEHEQLEKGILYDPITKGVFNAAKYLFLSYRIAELYPTLKASKIILQYQSPWPKQSYQNIRDHTVQDNYRDKYVGIKKTVSIMATFFVTNVFATPVAVQDMLIQMCSTIFIGYTVLIHIQLYGIFPVLILVPTGMIVLIIAFLYYFWDLLLLPRFDFITDCFALCQRKNNKVNAEVAVLSSENEEVDNENQLAAEPASHEGEPPAFQSFIDALKKDLGLPTQTMVVEEANDNDLIKDFSKRFIEGLTKNVEEVNDNDLIKDFSKNFIEGLTKDRNAPKLTRKPSVRLEHQKSKINNNNLNKKGVDEEEEEEDDDYGEKSHNYDEIDSVEEEQLAPRKGEEDDDDERSHNYDEIDSVEDEEIAPRKVEEEDGDGEKSHNYDEIDSVKEEEQALRENNDDDDDDRDDDSAFGSGDSSSSEEGFIRIMNQPKKGKSKQNMR
jgi:hypothetical protein